MDIFNRDIQTGQLSKTQDWDLVIIGGGATGLGAAVEAITQGWKTLLVEQNDFAKGTSSRSTKLAHGGVRYLAQGNISLVLEALHERGIMKKNAPHLVKNQSFIIPCYKWWVKPYYTFGLGIYDLMAGRLSLGRSLPYSRKRTLEYIPTLRLKNLRGGVVYHDGQFDDSRYAINLCQTFIEKGGTAINYCKVLNLVKVKDKIAGIEIRDEESGKTHTVKSKMVINATGIFVDDIIKMDNPKARHIVCPSQGVHLVLDKDFVPGKHAIMIPKTSDGRVLFAVPWHNKVVVGTTDVKKETSELEPKALEEEVNFILETAGRFLAKPPKRSDVKSVFAGLRPLALSQGNSTKTKEISRNHKIVVSKSGLVTIIGGKWTTYRRMGEDVIKSAAKVTSRKIKPSVTEHLPIHGYKSGVDLSDPLYVYGTDAGKITALADENKELGNYLSTDLGIIKAQVIWAVRFEMARTVEDFLARRTRSLFLDAKESLRMAPAVAKLMATELNYDDKWIGSQIQHFEAVAKNYIIDEV